MAPKTRSFRELVAAAAQRKGGEDPPFPKAVMAERCGISRQHLYNLETGRIERVGDYVIKRCARGLGVSEAVVRAAVAVSQRAAE